MMESRRWSTGMSTGDMMRRTHLFLNFMFDVKKGVPGLQEIELEVHAIKGMGKTHTKWSPAATAWYRMLPEVVLLQDIQGKKAEELVKKCPLGVFDLEDIGNRKLD